MATQRTRVFRLDGYSYKADPKHYGLIEREETQLLKDVLEELQKYDVLIGHNVKRFDLPYLKSRAFQREMRMPPMVVYDTLIAFRRSNYLTIPNNFGKPSAGLAMVADFLHVKQLKTSIFPHDWWETIWAKESARLAAMEEIIDHCKRDVMLNARVFEYLWAADPRPMLHKVY